MSRWTTPEVETRAIRASGVARINDGHNVKQVSLPRIPALADVADFPPLRRLATAIEPIPADKQARIAIIRACHRKMARAGMFDHCRYQP